MHCSSALGVLLLVVGLAGLRPVRAQENVQTRIPNWLTECYQNPALFQREQRLPSSINMLVELVRRFESAPGQTMDMREIATTLVHRFRMDGIERAPGQFLANVLPFSPSSFHFSKHRVLLARLIPGSGAAFPNDALAASERCALHFMLSTSVDRAARNDEAQVCGQLAQIRSMRIPRRRRRSIARPDNFLGDVELLEERHLRRNPANGRYMEYAPAQGEFAAAAAAADDDAAEDEADDEGVETPAVDGANGEHDPEQSPPIADDAPQPSEGDETPDHVEILSEAGTTALSQCPVENGVVRTLWGAVSAGPLITGIAAGLQPQSVQTRDLLALSAASAASASMRRHSMARQAQPAARVDNRWAATLAGDLAEVTLLQGPLSAQLQVGGVGGWNSTAVPRWYFLSQRDRLEMTDAEIRGGLDGLILALNVAEYRSRAQQLRLSQLLDMYYSQRGVYSTTAAACNRRSLFAQVAPVATLQAQTEAFSLVLDREMQMRFTLPLPSIGQFAATATQALSTYIPQSLNDPSCAATSINPRDPTVWRSAANMLIYIDASWTFRQIQPIIAGLVESLDVNPFGSNYTLLNARDGSVIAAASHSLSDFYRLWNETHHAQQAQGLSMPDVVRSMRSIGGQLMAAERGAQTNAHAALLALIVPQTAVVSDADTVFSLQQIAQLNVDVPDLTVLFAAGGGVATRFERFVRDPQRDLFALQATGSNADNVLVQTTAIIQRIQGAHRRIVNPRCGVEWSQDEQQQQHSQSRNQYVEPGSVNFYRLLPNYFFRASESDQRRIRVQGHGYAPITVCTSRTLEWPRQNATSDDRECRTLLSDSFDIALRDNCDGHGIIHRCPPVYVSVAGGIAGDDGMPFRCIDRECRYPDNIRFSIHTENLACFSGAARHVMGAGLLLAAVVALLSVRLVA